MTAKMVNYKPSMETVIPASALDALTEPRHRWYFLKEAFSPALVTYAIRVEKLPRNAVIFDPFSGGGTTVVEASRLGKQSYGHEVNPFLVDVAKAKLACCTAKQVRTSATVALAGALKGRRTPLEYFSTFSKSGGSDKWLFNRPVLRAFSGAWASLKTHPGPSRRILRIALIGAALDCANARKDGKCLRYRRAWREMNFEIDTFLDAFGNRVRDIVEDIESTTLPVVGKIFTADSRRRSLSARFDLCLTSPPYLNSFDYTDVYRPELFLGEYVSNMDQLTSVRRRTIRSHVQVRWTDPRSSDFGPAYDRIASDLKERVHELWSQRIPLMTQAYFEDLQRVLVNLRAQAKRGAAAWFVVSTSAYAGIHIPVDVILSEVAERSGWSVRSVNKMRNLGRVANQQWAALSNGSQRPALRECVVILDA